ncbi:myotubularin-related protein 9-like [Diretmus argenteus]
MLISGSSGTITIKCKDLCVLQLDIPGMEQCLNIAQSIETLSSLDCASEMYPFFYRPPDLCLQSQWGLSSPEKHYAQMKELRDKWRLSDVNRDYSVCPSYPPAVIVPKAIDDDMLVKVAKFRLGGRFPVLCYYHRKNGMAGHPFQQRCAHSAYSHARLQHEAPVFLLLLDCVWQLWRQFPLALGFSDALLLRLATESYASNYGTFLCNSDQERRAVGVKENTHCLFRALLSSRETDHYSNPLYEPTELAIWPSIHPQSLQLWRGFFLRWTQQARHLEEAQEEMRNMVIEWSKLTLS